MNKLVMTLSGEICSKGSASLINFWCSFINIQRSISDIDNLQVVGHSMNPEYDDMIKSVYGIVLLSSDVPVEPHSNSKPNLQINIANITSKKKSLMLLEQLDIDSDSFVLSAGWIMCEADCNDFRPIVFDPSLPNEYLYLAYHKGVDKGYSTGWCFSSIDNIKYLSSYAEYLSNILLDKSNSFKKYATTPWPLAIKINKNKWDTFKKILFTTIDEKVNFQAISQFIPVLNKRIYGLEYRLKKILEKPVFTGENSLLSCSDTNVLLSDYGDEINEESLFKSFMLETGLRDKTRFLDNNDFEKVSNGLMINPIEFGYVIYTHSCFSASWRIIIEQALRYLPSNCCKIYLVSEASDNTDRAFVNMENGEFELITYNDEDPLILKLQNVFIKVNNDVEYIYFVHDNMPLISNLDAIFLNSLLHFLDNSSEDYIQLTGNTLYNGDVSCELFPCLVKQTKNCQLFLQPSMIKASCFIKQIIDIDEKTLSFENLFTGSNVSFSVIYDEKSAGRLNKGNRFFPHAQLNISKNIDAKIEWEKDIEFQTNQYERIRMEIG